MNPVMVDVIDELKRGASGARIELANMTISIINDNGEIVGRADACGDTYDLDEDELMEIEVPKEYHIKDNITFWKD